MTAAKHTDPIIGMDMHMIQPPAPAPPVMVPHPAVGIVMDPADYSPGACTIAINGLPRARAGTACLLSPPHMPIGGVFVKRPLGEAELYQGSSTVIADGEALSAMSHQVLGCHDVGSLAPSRSWKHGGAKSLMAAGGVVVPLCGGMPVNVGGAPTVSASGQDGETVDVDWLYVEICDTNGEPLQGAGYEIELADGCTRSGLVSTSGIVELWAVPSGRYKLSLRASLDSCSCSDATVVGPPFSRAITHRVLQGEDVHSIAASHCIGRKWREVWESPENQLLRERRPDPCELLPSDEMIIPARLLERFELTTGQRHHVDVEIAMSHVDLVLYDSRRRLLRRRAVAIEWAGRGSPIELNTDADGHARFSLPTSSPYAVLTVDATPEGSSEQVSLRWWIHMRALDPSDTQSGMDGRLANVGMTAASVRHSLGASGREDIDEATRLADFLDKKTRVRK